MRRILLVDDDRTMVFALSIRLRSAGMEVLSCHDAHVAAQLAIHEHPDAVVLDIDMPGFTGLEMHECLNLAPRGKRIPVIYLSGSSSLVDRQIAFRQGAKAFLSKPIESKALIDMIRTVLPGSGAQECDPGTRRTSSKRVSGLFHGESNCAAGLGDCHLIERREDLSQAG